MERTEILRQMETERRQIEKSVKRLGELQTQLDSCNEEDWDWIPVSTAARLIDVSVQYMYRRVDAGKLKTKYVGSKLFLSKKEILTINDKYERKVG